MITFGDGATDYFRSIITDLIHRGYVVELHGAEVGPVDAILIGWVKDGDNELIYQPVDENPDGTDLIPAGERRTVTLVDLERIEVH